MAAEWNFWWCWLLNLHKGPSRLVRAFAHRARAALLAVCHAVYFAAGRRGPPVFDCGEDAHADAFCATFSARAARSFSSCEPVNS